MSRQINLYSPELRVSAKRFSAIWVVAGAIMVTVLSLFDYAWEARNLKQMQAAQAAGDAQLKQLRDQVLSLGKPGQKVSSKAMQDQVARAEAQLTGRQELFDWLQSGQLGNREGYAKFLTAFAHQHLDGVWLTSIELSGGQADFTIKGRALRADLLPVYIKMLRNEEVLRGRSIGTLALREKEIEPKSKQKLPAGPEGVSAAKAEAAKSAPPAQAAVRVVEFALGSEAAAPAKEAASQ